MKNIWILNHYATSMFYEQGGRHYSFAKYLVRDGYKPVIFCASTIHNKQQQIDLNGALYVEKGSEIGAPFVFVKARKYVGNGKARVLNMLDFYRNVKTTCKQFARENNLKPDVIYASSVHPLTLVAGIKLAKHFGIKCVCEVRDLWPESIVAHGILGKGNLLIWLLYRLEKWIYAQADAMIFTMEGGREYIVEKGWDTAHGGPIDLNKIYYINNGVDLEVFAYNRENYKMEDPDLAEPDTFKVIYTGSIRQANGLEMLLRVAKLLQDQPNIRFLVYGDGDERKPLEGDSRKDDIRNLVFKGKVEKQYIPYILSQSDLNILHYRQAVCVEKYGGSQNKLFEYLASGKPTLSNIKLKYDVIEEYKCGITEETGTIEGYAQEVLNFSKLLKNEYNQLCENAKTAATDFDFRKLTNKLLIVMKDLYD